MLRSRGYLNIFWALWLWIWCEGLKTAWSFSAHSFYSTNMYWALTTTQVPCSDQIHSSPAFKELRSKKEVSLVTRFYKFSAINASQNKHIDVFIHLFIHSTSGCQAAVTCQVLATQGWGSPRTCSHLASHLRGVAQMSWVRERLSRKSRSLPGRELGKRNCSEKDGIQGIRGWGWWSVRPRLLHLHSVVSLASSFS